MLRGWASYVRRFIGDIHSTPIKDAIIWGADDYIGALSEARLKTPEGSVLPGYRFSSMLGWIRSIPNIGIYRSRRRPLRGKLD